MPPSSPHVVNPLVRARNAVPLSQAELAAQMDVSTNVIKFAEAGCYNVIPSCYRNFFPKLLSHDTIREYQLFRRLKRLNNFPTSTINPPWPVGFRKHPPNSLQNLLEDLETTAYGFAVSACVQHAEVYKLLENKKVTLPSNLVDFFQTIGLSDDWILEFNRNINREYYEAG